MSDKKVRLTLPPDTPPAVVRIYQSITDKRNAIERKRSKAHDAVESEYLTDMEALKTELHTRLAEYEKAVAN